MIDSVYFRNVISVAKHVVLMNRSNWASGKLHDHMFIPSIMEKYFNKAPPYSPSLSLSLSLFIPVCLSVCLSLSLCDGQWGGRGRGGGTQSVSTIKKRLKLMRKKCLRCKYTRALAKDINKM